MSPEEFFMYLTIALIVLIPISARVYRYFTMRQVTRMLRQQFDQTAEQSKTNDRPR
ncbi:MAG: hypothetical protein ACREI2_02405 [Nitrospiraceae bacterium]